MSLQLIANGKTFTFRMLTEEEASKIQDKKRLALLDKNHSMYDDGDKEILATVVSPTKEETELFLEENGNFFDQAWQRLIALAGDQDTEEVPLSDEIKSKYHFPVLCVRWVTKEGKEEHILFRKITRADTKLIKREMAETGLLLNRMLRERVKLLCLEKEKAEKIAEQHPFFFVNIGWFLWQKTFATIEGEVKKA